MPGIRTQVLQKKVGAFTTLLKEDALCAVFCSTDIQGIQHRLLDLG
jgi:hypothetical protein